jgi:hypothetical protein
MKTRELPSPVSPEIASFAVMLEMKMEREGYDHLEAWKDLKLSFLLTQLRLKAAQLGALDPANAHDIENKSIVLAVLAMMTMYTVNKDKIETDEEVAPSSEKIPIGAGPSITRVRERGRPRRVARARKAN